MNPIVRFYFNKIAFLLLLSLLPLKTATADSLFEEYQIKAALLLKLVNFVTWPNLDEKDNSGQFTICILGENDFGDFLSNLDGRSNNGNIIKIEYFEQSISLLGTCQIAFINKSKKASLKSILSNINNFPILTVGDTDDFAKSGGMIQFLTNQGRLEIDINLKAAIAANLKISALLLQLANIVETK